MTPAALDDREDECRPGCHDREPQRPPEGVSEPVGDLSSPPCQRVLQIARQRLERDVHDRRVEDRQITPRITTAATTHTSRSRRSSDRAPALIFRYYPACDGDYRRGRPGRRDDTREVRLP